MACQPGFIEIDGNCVYDFTSSVNADGTPKTPANGGGSFWDNVGGFLEKNAGNIGGILGGIGGILGGGKKDNEQKTNPATPPATPPEGKKSNTLLWVVLAIVVVAGLFLFVYLKKKKALPVAA